MRIKIKKVKVWDAAKNSVSVWPEAEIELAAPDLEDAVLQKATEAFPQLREIKGATVEFYGHDCTNNLVRIKDLKVVIFGNAASGSIKDDWENAQRHVIV